jgi:NADH-quinone oxidoreductase subunit L
MAPILVLLSIGLPWIGAALVWMNEIRYRDDPARFPNLHLLAVIFSAAAGLSALLLLFFTTSYPVIQLDMGQFFGELSFVPDGLGVFLTAIATVIGSLAIIFSVEYMRGEDQLGRYYVLVLVFIGSMSGLVLTGSMLFLFVFWEMTALCSYGLISFYNDDPKAVAGGIKALIITQVGGAGLLAGALIIYSYTGSFSINDFLDKYQQLPPMALSLVSIGFLIAAAAKSAQVPFHTWLPDAMEAPTPVSALIHAATMVNAGVYLLARFYPAFADVPDWKTSVVIVGMMSALLAGVMAIFADDLKRVLAYSTVSQLGYMVYAIGVGGVFASQFHLFSHAIFKALLFLGAGTVIHTVKTRDMRWMGALGREMPFTRNVFVIGALALAGLPILNGFWSKELVLEIGVEGQPAWAYYVMLLVAGMTAFYTFRMVWMVFFGNERRAAELILPGQQASHIHDAPRAMRAALAPLALGTFISWLFAGGLNYLLVSTLPFHEIEPESTLELVTQIVTAPETLIALGVIALGLAAWWWKDRLAGMASSFEWLGRIARQNFGFEWFNSRIVELTQAAASSLARLQTGQLSWNLVGLVCGLILALIYLAWGV